MLHLIPAGVHRTLLRLAHGVRRVWWRLARPRFPGVCVIARDERGRVLLLRQSYGTRCWVLPGGGLGRGEDPAGAARREFREEAGCELADLAFAGISTEPLGGATNDVHLFTGRIEGEPRADGREVTELALFDPAALPPDASPRIARRLALAGI